MDEKLTVTLQMEETPEEREAESLDQKLKAIYCAAHGQGVPWKEGEAGWSPALELVYKMEKRLKILKAKNAVTQAMRDLDQVQKFYPE